MRLNSEAETCAICCNEVQPSRAVRLGCRHGWYCATCIKRHAEARLATGASDVTCPECREPIQDHNLRNLLEPDIIDRLHDRSVKQAIASSSNLVMCPTPNCDMCVELEEGEEPWLKRCPKCRKSSCLQCRVQPYHRGMTCQQYCERRAAGGRSPDEENLFRWMRRTGTKQCPKCKMGVSKQNLENQNNQYQECHKMICRHCKTKFCFKCLSLLTETFTCRCSIDAHGFIDPETGLRIQHLQDGARPSVRATPTPTSHMHMKSTAAATVRAGKGHTAGIVARGRGGGSGAVGGSRARGMR